MNPRRLMVGMLCGLGVAALALPSMHAPAARIVYNPSDSVPRGWYRIGPTESLCVGGVVLVNLPAEIAALAARRGYLPAGIPLLKRIGAIPPQQVCIDQRTVLVDGEVVATVLAADRKGRPMPVWQQCRPLAEDEVFLLSSTDAASFDSRYFGPLSASAVIGSAQSLWTWDKP